MIYLIDNDKELQEAVTSFQIAANKLLTTMNRIDQDTDYRAYPFDKCFLEVVADITEWETSLIFKE